MTVKELIEHLQTFPQEFQVAYRCCSDSAKLEADDVYVILATDKKVVQHHNMKDRIRDYNPSDYGNSKYASCAGLQPDFISVVMFPGN